MGRRRKHYCVRNRNRGQCVALQIVEHVPELVKNLKKENSPSSQLMLQTLAELLHCLMYLHTGFPELYSPLLDVLQVCPHFWPLRMV